MNIRNKMTMLCLAGVLTASVLSTGSVYSYDGDVDYSAPYVTLDPKTGKLVTIDPKQEQAAAQQQQEQHPVATSADGSTSTPAADTANSGGSVASISTAASTTPAPASNPTTAVFIAIAAIVIIGIFVAITRRKSAVTPDKSDL